MPVSTRISLSPTPDTFFAIRALTSVNILKNDIKDEGINAMEAVLKKSKTLKSICGASGPELDLSGQHLGAEDAKVVAIELKNNGALACADGRYYHEWQLNPRHGEVEAAFLQLDGDADELESSAADWATPLADSFAPNVVLDIVVASPALANGDITNSTQLNGKVALVDRGGCSFVEKAQRVQAAGAIAMICVNNDENEPDKVFGMAGNDEDEGPEGITIPAIMISFNNGTKVKSGVSVVYHVKTPPKFISSAPDVDGQDKDPGVPLANGICQHCGQPKDQHHAKLGALAKLDLSNNNLGQESDRGGMQALSDMLKTNAVLKELDMSSNYMDSADAKMLSEGIAANGALASLDLSQNNVPEPERGQIKATCEAKGIALKL